MTEISQFQKLKINLIINYPEINPVDIYEYDSSNIYSKYNKYGNYRIIFDKNNNKEMFTSLSTIAEYENTNYIFKEFILKNKEIKIYEIVFNLKDDIPRKINNIKSND